jgi:hypothetical protein
VFAAPVPEETRSMSDSEMLSAALEISLHMAVSSEDELAGWMMAQ